MVSLGLPLLSALLVFNSPSSKIGQIAIVWHVKSCCKNCPVLPLLIVKLDLNLLEV